MYPSPRVFAFFRPCLTRLGASVWVLASALCRPASLPAVNHFAKFRRKAVDAPFREEILCIITRRHLKSVLLLSLGTLFFVFGVHFRIRNYQLYLNNSEYGSPSLSGKHSQHEPAKSDAETILSTMLNCSRTLVGSTDFIESNSKFSIPHLHVQVSNTSISAHGCMHEFFLPKSKDFYSRLLQRGAVMESLKCYEFLDLVFGKMSAERQVIPSETFLNFTAYRLFAGLTVLNSLTSAFPFAVDNQTFEFVGTQNQSGIKDSTLTYSKEEPFAFFGIFSRPEGLAQRMGVRETWLNYETFRRHEAKYKFFVGLSTNLSVNIAMIEESLRYGDMIILPYIDHYDVLTLKTLSLCIYAESYLPWKVRYVVKADDDTFVRVDAILDKLRGNTLALNRTVYYGSLVYNGLVARNPKSKWFVTTREWPGFKYPTWGHGPMFSISSDMNTRIVDMFNNGNLDYFKLEDISMAIWVSKVKDVNTLFWHDNTLIYDGCRKDFSMAHYQSPSHMKCLWNKALSTSNVTCC